MRFDIASSALIVGVRKRALLLFRITGTDRPQAEASAATAGAKRRAGSKTPVRRAVS